MGGGASKKKKEEAKKDELRKSEQKKESVGNAAVKSPENSGDPLLKGSPAPSPSDQSKLQINGGVREKQSDEKEAFADFLQVR